MRVLPQFVRFTGVGFLSAIGHYGLLILLVQGRVAEPVSASLAGALLGAWINYAANYRYTFQSTKRHRESGTKFIAVALVSLILSAFLMWVGVYVMSLHYLLSQVFTTMLVLFWSFTASRRWTFRSYDGI